MANYTLIDCFSGNSYVVYFDSTANLGTVWSFSSDTSAVYCGTIESENIKDSPNYSAITSYRTCYECFTGPNGFAVLMETCTNDGESFTYYQDPGQFPEIPVINSVYKFCEPEIGEPCICFKVLSIEQSESSVKGIYDSGPYIDCENCLTGFITKTANTIYEACVVCCPCESGETITSVSVPHPTFTDLYGNPVIQGNAVLIGGNGLNS